MGEEENSLYILEYIFFSFLSFFSFISLDLNQRSIRMLKLEVIFKFLYNLLPEFK